MLVRINGEGTPGDDASPEVLPVARIVGFPDSRTLNRIASCDSLGSPVSLPQSPLSRMLKTASWPCLQLKINNPRGSGVGSSGGGISVGSISPAFSGETMSPDHLSHAHPISIPKLSSSQVMETARNCRRESCQALQYIESHLQPEPSPQSVSLHTQTRRSDDIDMAFECD